MIQRKVSQSALEERIIALENEVSQIRSALGAETRPSDWRSTVGMFSGNQLMKEIDAAGQKLRDQDRQRARK